MRQRCHNWTGRYTSPLNAQWSTAWTSLARCKCGPETTILATASGTWTRGHRNARPPYCLCDHLRDDIYIIFIDLSVGIMNFDSAKTEYRQKLSRLSRETVSSQNFDTLRNSLYTSYNIYVQYLNIDNYREYMYYHT